MKLIKFILPITALLLAFTAINTTAQICVYNANEKYELSQAIVERGDNLEFIKFCCEQLGRCTQNYIVDDKYTLTHVAAREHKLAVLKYLAEEKHIPVDEYPLDMTNGLHYDKKSYTTVMFAAKKAGGLDTIKYLVEEKGVSIVEQNDNHESALTLAKKTDDMPMINYIQEAVRKAGAYGAIINKKNLIKFLTPAAIKEHLAQNSATTAATAIAAVHTKPFSEANLI